VESNPITQKSQEASTKGGEDKKKEEEKKKESGSIHSQLTSSLMETSEDEEARRKEAERAAKKAKKGFSEAELNQIIDVELKETNTITFMFIPGTVVNTETSEVELVTAENKNYEALKQSKIGSDSYTVRGT
jgi:hypothetical protein